MIRIADTAARQQHPSSKTTLGGKQMNTIGSRIAENRRRIGMTQEELAAKLAVSAQAVSKWENEVSLR